MSSLTSNILGFFWAQIDMGLSMNYRFGLPKTILFLHSGSGGNRQANSKSSRSKKQEHFLILFSSAAQKWQPISPVQSPPSPLKTGSLRNPNHPLNQASPAPLRTAQSRSASSPNSLSFVFRSLNERFFYSVLLWFRFGCPV